MDKPLVARLTTAEKDGKDTRFGINRPILAHPIVFEDNHSNVSNVKQLFIQMSHLLGDQHIRIKYIILLQRTSWYRMK